MDPDRARTALTLMVTHAERLAMSVVNDNVTKKKAAYVLSLLDDAEEVINALIPPKQPSNGHSKPNSAQPVRQPVRNNSMAYRSRYVSQVLTEKQVDELMHYYSTGMKIKEIAQRYGIHPNTVRNIVKRVTQGRRGR